MRLIYELVLHLYVLFSLPKVFYMMVKKGKYKKSFLQRFGKGFPKIEKEGRPLIWVHAVSYGETKAVFPLIKKLKAHQKKPKILLTAATETGHLEGKKMEDVDYCAYLPLDFSNIMRPILRRVKPDVVILTESDFWFNFLNEAKNLGAKTVLVNGKLSETSYNRFKKIPFFTRKLFSLIDLFCLQGELYKERFKDIGIPENKMVVTGNIKLNALDQAPQFDRKNLHLNESDFVLTLGSTHSPEEALFLDHFDDLLKKCPDLKLFVAPRHPERLSFVSELLKKKGLGFNTLSSNKGFQENRIVLVDKMGVLKSCYSVSDLAFVGGTFLKKVGGHNILEPSFYGVPVLFGPYLHSQPDFLALMNAFNAGVCLKKETIVPTLIELISNKEKRQNLGNNGKKLILSSTSSLGNTLAELNSCLKWS